jgi:hypothetical protein
MISLELLKKENMGGNTEEYEKLIDDKLRAAMIIIDSRDVLNRAQLVQIDAATREEVFTLGPLPSGWTYPLLTLLRGVRETSDSRCEPWMTDSGEIGHVTASVKTVRTLAEQRGLVTPSPKR